jgi:outer membrane protein assembly factor BamB
MRTAKSRRPGRKRSITVAVIVCLAAAAPTARGFAIGIDGLPRPELVESAEWPEFQFDRENTGENPLEAVVGPENVAKLLLDWEVDLTDVVTLNSSPVLSGGLVYAAVGDTPSGRVHAIDPNSGVTVWVTTLPNSHVFTAPAVADGMLVVGSADWNVYALDAATGQRAWTFPTSGGVFSSPTILDGVAYIGSNDGYIYALSLSTGEVVWKRRLGLAAGVRSPAIADGVVYASTAYTFRVFALDAATGQKLWSRRLVGGYIDSGPALDSGRVYVTTEHGTLFSLDAATGGVLWRVTALGEGLRNPAVAGGVVFVGSPKKWMFALDAATGARVWATRVDGELFSPIVANGVVYAGGRENKLYAFDVGTGDLLWTAVAGALVSNPILVDGRLYFGAFDNHLYAYALP